MHVSSATYTSTLVRSDPGAGPRNAGIGPAGKRQNALLYCGSRRSLAAQASKRAPVVGRFDENTGPAFAQVMRRNTVTRHLNRNAMVDPAACLWRDPEKSPPNLPRASFGMGAKNAVRLWRTTALHDGRPLEHISSALDRPRAAWVCRSATASQTGIRLARKCRRGQVGWILCWHPTALRLPAPRSGEQFDRGSSVVSTPPKASVALC